MEGRFTEEELAIAKSVDLCAVAESLGYTVKRIGKYHTLKEMDSIRIYDRSHWYRWSRQFDKGNNGGSQIDFLRVFGGMSVKEAVFWLLDFAGYRRIESTAKQPLVHQVTKKQPQNLWRNTMDWAMRLRTVLRQQDIRITMNGLLLQNLILQMRKRSR